MADASPTRRLRWYQFRLRSLLLAMTALILVLVAWRLYVAPRVASYRRQQQTIELIKKLGGSYQSTPAPNWMRRLTGEDFQDVELVDLADCDDPDAYIEHVAALPKLEMLAVGGDKFADAHLERLRQTITLRGLVLDSTAITAAALNGLKETRSELDVHLCPRRIVARDELINRVESYARQAPGANELREGLRDKFFATCPAAMHLQFPEPDEPRLSRLWQLNGPLTELMLTGPGISDDSLAHLRGLASLWRLHVYCPKVTDEGLLHLQSLHGLKDLLLNEASVTDAGLARLSTLENLAYLNLNKTQVRGPGLTSLAVLPQLVSLNLSRTKVDDAALAHLCRLPKLRGLGLARTQVSDAGLVHLRDVPLLENLGIGGPGVTDVGMAKLKDLKNLASLQVEGTSVRGEGLRHVADLPRLRFIALAGDSIMDSALRPLKRSRLLQTLHLRRTQITAEAVSEFRKATPNCKVDWDGRH